MGSPNGEIVLPVPVLPPKSSSPQVFDVGTRRSKLARIQTGDIVATLRQVWPEHRFEVHAMATAGDNNQQTALHKFYGKVLLTENLEVLLQDGRLDFIVHSLKDMPTLARWFGSRMRHKTFRPK